VHARLGVREVLLAEEIVRPHLIYRTDRADKIALVAERHRGVHAHAAFEARVGGGPLGAAGEHALSRHESRVRREPSHPGAHDLRRSTRRYAPRARCFTRSAARELAQKLGTPLEKERKVVKIARSLRETPTRVLASLTPRKECVLRMRFGIGINTDHMLEEVGHQFSGTRERIRQIGAKALRS
jgi:hypothetical protein